MLSWIVDPVKILNEFELSYSAAPCRTVLGIVLLAQIFSVSPAAAQIAENGVLQQSEGANSSYAPRGALGMVVTYNQERRLIVSTIVPGGPAALRDIAVGDELLAVGGNSIKMLPPEQIFQSLLGAPGTSIELTLQSPTRGQYLVNLTRVSAESLAGSANFTVGWQQDGPSAGVNASTGGGINTNTGSSSSINTSSVSTGTNTSISTNSSINTSSGIGNNVTANVPGVNASSTGWKSYGGAQEGFSVRYPDGWSVNQDPKSGRIEMANTVGSKLSIFPFFLPDQSLKIDQAQGLFEAVLKQYAQGPQWSAPSYVGGGLRSISTAGNMNSISGLTLSSIAGGTSGRLIILQVPNDSRGETELTTLSQILQSFAISGLPEQAAVPDGEFTSGGQNDRPDEVEFTKFIDPNFNAFSLDVPSGWNVSGGMKRPMPVDLRPWVKAVSPDEKIGIFIGDGSIEPRYLPASWLNFLGCPPGSTYKASTGLVSKVLYYEPADKFVRKYVESRFGKTCDTCELVNVEHHPDLAREINGTVGVVASDAASVKYNFSTKGKQGVAYFLAATKKGREMWWVSQICGLVAESGYEQQALEIFLRMYKSWQYNPQWSQGQSAVNVQSTQNYIAADRAARARSAAAFSARMSAMDARHNSFMNRMREMDASHARYMNSMRSSDRAHSNFINYIRGEDTLMNPETGTKYQVEYGPKYQWVNSTGDTVLGTNSAWSPGVNWTELVTPPKQ